MVLNSLIIRGVSTLRPIIKEKAKILSKKFPGEKKCFKPSEGWLHKWENLYGMCQVNMDGEKLSVDEVEAMLYCDELTDIIFDHGYCMINFSTQMRPV